MKYTEKELEKYSEMIQDVKQNKVEWKDVEEEIINNLVFTEEEIKRVVVREYRIFERINKKHSSIEEYNDDNNKIIKDGERYKLVSVSDGDVMEIFDTNEDVEKFLEKEKAIEIEIINYILHEIDDEYSVARVSLMFHNLQKASDEVNEEFSRLAEIDKGEETICVGNYFYFNMGDNYIKMNIHDFTKTTVKEVDYSDFVITKDIK